MARPSAMPQGRLYVPLLRLAEGGMGTVDLAVRREGRFNRLHAIKRPLAQYRDEPQFRSMFLDEARVAGMIRHPNVIGVIDVGEDEQGLFLVMDYIEGVSAAHLIRAALPRESLLPISLVAAVTAQVARGLHAVHELRTSDGKALLAVHRDVSPQNILIGYDGHVRLTDFGIVRAYGNDQRTLTGALKGNAGYMAPEVLRFEELDRRADLFSLGVVLYELLTRRRLYREPEFAQMARRIVHEPAPDPGEQRNDVPPALTELTLSLLAKHSCDRPPNALVVANQLEEILAESGADEGHAFDLSSYLETQFVDERAARSSAIAAAVCVAEERSTPLRQESSGKWKMRLVLPSLGVLTGALVWLALVELSAAQVTPVAKPTALDGKRLARAETVSLPAPVSSNMPTPPAPLAAPNPFTKGKPIKTVKPKAKSVSRPPKARDGLELPIVESW